MTFHTYTTAAKRLSTAQNANRKIPGPIRPMPVINLLTERTLHFRLISLSAKCPDTGHKKPMMEILR